MSVGVEHGVCIDCGRHTHLRLARRFPHICTECLFPPRDVDDSHEDELVRMKEEGWTKPSLVEQLAIRVNGFKFDRPFGYREVPDPRRRETGD